MKSEGTLVQLSGRGEITLPEEVRKSLSLRSGDAFQLFVKDGQIILEPVEVTPVELYTDERLREFRNNSEMTEDEVAQARKAWGL